MPQQFPVLVSPGIRAAVEGIFETLHTGLVAIKNGGAAGEGKENQSGQPDQSHALGSLIRAQAEGCPGFPGLRNVIGAQNRQNPGVSWVPRKFMAE